MSDGPRTFKTNQFGVVVESADSKLSKENSELKTENERLRGNIEALTDVCLQVHEENRRLNNELEEQQKSMEAVYYVLEVEVDKRRLTEGSDGVSVDFSRIQQRGPLYLSSTGKVHLSCCRYCNTSEHYRVEKIIIGNHQFAECCINEESLDLLDECDFSGFRRLQEEFHTKCQQSRRKW